MATNQRPLLDEPFTAWVATLSTAPSSASRIWCVDCQRWHSSAMECRNPRHCYVCNEPPAGHNQRTAHIFQSNEDVQQFLAKAGA